MNTKGTKGISFVSFVPFVFSLGVLLGASALGRTALD